MRPLRPVSADDLQRSEVPDRGAFYCRASSRTTTITFLSALGTSVIQSGSLVVCYKLAPELSAECTTQKPEVV